MDIFVGEKGVELAVGLNRTAVLCAEFGRVEFAGGINGGDLRVRSRIDRGDVRSGDPTIANDADVVLFSHHITESHGIGSGRRCKGKSGARAAYDRER